MAYMYMSRRIANKNNITMETQIVSNGQLPSSISSTAGSSRLVLGLSRQSMVRGRHTYSSPVMCMD